MNRNWIAIAFALAALLAAPAMGNEVPEDTPVTLVGVVTNVEPERRTLKVGEDLFHVPADVATAEQLAGLRHGVVVTLEYREVDGRNVVTGGLARQ